MPIAKRLRLDIERCGVLLAGMFLAHQPASAALFPAGTSRFPPVAVSAAAPNRQALIVVPAFSGGGENPRGAVAQADAKRYKDLLRLLGFSVTVVAADTKPGLDVATKEFAKAVRPDADVAVFVLGSVVGVGDKLFIPASDLPISERTEAKLATEGVNVGDFLRRIRDRGPRELVAIIDECGKGKTDPVCAIGPDTVLDGASLIVAKRTQPAGSAPVAALASLRDELLPLMKQTELSFLKLYGRLKDKLAGSNVALVTTPALSPNFAFLPAEFLQKLPNECNEVDAGMSAETLRAMPEVNAQINACERAARQWDFAGHFASKLATAREQLALQKALAGCSGGAARAYLDTYRDGAYRFAVSDQVDKCARQNAPPPAPSPPPPPAPAPPPAASEASFQQRAYAAVVTYYERHNYTAGEDLSAVTALYPPVFAFKGRSRSRSYHIGQLESYYRNLSSFHIGVVPGSLDFSGCDDASSCLVRGSSQASFRSLTENAPRYALSRFSLRFDLGPPLKVLYECAVPLSRVGKEAPCD